MRIAIISDTHGNALALDAVLADIAEAAPDQIVCLGDAIQGGPQPVELVARLRTLACPVVLGNADAYLLSGEDSDAEAVSAERLRKLDAVRSWQLAELSTDDIAFIKTFQPTVALPLGNGQRLLCFHGSPTSFDDVIVPLTPDEEVQRVLDLQDDTIYTGGHTHVQFVRHFGCTFHFNPGSVGLAYRHGQQDHTLRANPWAEYALLTVTAGRVALEFRRVPFDVARLIDVYRASGRPFAEDSIAMYAAD